jgi:hypothetical protein
MFFLGEIIKTELRRHGHHWSAGNQTFRYENVWQTHGDYDKVVRDLWQKAEKGVGLAGYVK